MRIAAGLLFLALAACAPSQETIPSEQEAETFFAEVIEIAATGDVEELCRLGGSSCERILGEAGPVPLEPPSLVGIRALPPTNSDGAVTTGGQILEACGEADGEIYYTEMLVFREDGQLFAIEPIYWSGFSVESDGTVGGQPPDASARCNS
jgi:hypothetical protein